MVCEGAERGVADGRLGGRLPVTVALLPPSPHPDPPPTRPPHARHADTAPVDAAESCHTNGALAPR
jgi:hypothetical protein